MDHQRVHRIGNRTYYRSNYMQSPNSRPTIEERLHAHGISTSSNSSWTFSNSHSDLPKKKKGRLCGLFLMVAVFVVLIAVIAIGGLAFYLGALRVDNTKQEMIFDGSLRVTYGDQYQTTLNNHSSKAYREKAARYTNMLTNVYQRSILAPALDEVRILRFENGSLIVHFRMNLDRRKLPESVISVEDVLRSIMIEEISSVKPVAFRNLQVDHQNLYFNRYLGDLNMIPDSHSPYRVPEEAESALKVKNGVVRKVNGPEVKHHQPKPQQNRTTVIPEGTIIGISERMQNFTEAIRKRAEEQSTTKLPTTEEVKVEEVQEEDIKSMDFNAEAFQTDQPLVLFSESPPGMQLVLSTSSTTEESIAVPIGVVTENIPMNGHARPTFEIRREEPILVTQPQIPPEFVAISADYDEPWRPILPPLRKHIVTEEPSIPPSYEDLEMVESSVGPAGPITFSRESYEQNLRVPEYETDPKLNKMTEEIAKKYEQIVKKHQVPEEEEKRTEVDHLPLGLDQIISGISVVDVEESTEAEAMTTTEQSTDAVNETVKSPFQESEDSRSAPAFSFELPDFPILKQFHHLDSLLKSFTAETSTEDINATTVTRFPVRTRPTSVDDKVYVAVSTIAPEAKSPVVVRGEVQVMDSKAVRSSETTTEPPKLITLLPVRSNLRGPLRPRPKDNQRSSKMGPPFKTGSSRVVYSIPQKHHFVDDKDGKRWVYYSSSKWVTTTTPTSKTEKLFIVTPQAPDGPETREEPDEETETAIADTSELINRIVNIMENVVISTGNSTKVILKVNQTIINGTDLTGNGKLNETDLDESKFVISNKAVSSHYKLNQAGVPILTKILNKAPNYYTNDKNETGDAEPEVEPLKVVCDNTSIACGNGSCLPLSARCNQQVDCPDAADEKNCTCAEHLKTQHLNRKLCDGVVDCWDFSDEFGCDFCKGKDYLCSNSKICIRKMQICDGVNNCPMGDDERYCVTVSPSKREANSFNYHPNGYLMVRKHGEWGKLCIDNFDSVSMKSKTGWKITDLGRSVCKALTFKDFDKVERMISVPNEGRSIEESETDRYYELSYSDVTSLEESSTRDSSLSFHETQCSKKEVVRVTCTELECGLRPQAMNQWSRIVGGGNANPGSWPWQAALYKEGEFQCGATLISGQWLVSAGHCFYHNQDEYWVARLGTLRTTSSLPSPYEQLRQISKIILHPHYVDTGFINDISLLKMSDPVTFTDFVRPICLPKASTKISDGMMCTVVGWGQLFEIGRIFPDTLQEVQLPIISSTECRKRTVFLPLYKITDDMFCAGYDRGGRDACLGDSGGPLMCQESDGKWSLYGVTSNGYGCARSNRPGVYTKVSKYLNWLQAQMHLYSEDEILSHSSFKQLSSAGETRENITRIDKETDALIKLISERVSNVKFNTGMAKKKDKCKGHRCPLGECLSKSRLCNGVIECSDGSDEKDCW